MKFLMYILFFVIFTSINTALSIPSHTLRNKRDISDADDEWLKELEAQVLNPDDLQGFLYPPTESKLTPNPVYKVSDGKNSEKHDVINDGENDNIDNRIPVEEPIVVTAKPYLTGDLSEEKTTEIVSMQEEPEDNIQDENATIEMTTTIKPAKDNKKNDVTMSRSKWKTSFSMYSTHSGFPISTSTSTNTPYYPEIKRNLSNPILDKILVEKPLQSQPKFFKPSRNEISDDGSEVGTFVVLIRNQTPFIILGCILSSIVLIALVVSAYQILKKLNDRSAVTLIAHYEHDHYGQLILKDMETQKTD